MWGDTQEDRARGREKTGPGMRVMEGGVVVLRP